ncbi:MAG: hypothetical protein K2O88_01375 [Paramuribaculum sp.]|nr:hypothetical protein [Paramuribaculum sp.]
MRSLQSKAKLLTERYRLLLHQKQLQDSELQQLQHTVKQQQKQIALLEQQLEQMRVVTPLTVKGADLERSRAVLTHLVRDIDKCIAELTD